MQRPHDPDPAPTLAPTVEPEALLLTVVHSVADAVITGDEQGLITMWTGGAETIFGWSADEILGREILVIVPEQHRAAHSAGLQRMADGGEQHVIGRGPVELTALRRDGQEFPAELTLTAGFHSGRRFFAAVVRDVSARHQTDARLRAVLAELERSNTELQRFASIASHDLNEPLRVVDGYLELLRSRYEGRLDDQADVFIGHAVAAVRRMQQLIDDLLRFARAGDGAARADPVDLQGLVADVLASLAPTIIEAGALVDVADLPPVTGDESLLRQVVQNLVTNALKFTRDGHPPRIEISSSRRPGSWEISVADHGIGVDIEAAGRIFEMFGRGRGTGNTRTGSGIGLAICKRAVEAHGGAIRVEPVIGGGADFRFVIPDRD